MVWEYKIVQIDRSMRDFLNSNINRIEHEVGREFKSKYQQKNYSETQWDEIVEKHYLTPI